MFLNSYTFEISWVLENEFLELFNDPQNGLNCSHHNFNDTATCFVNESYMSDK